MMIHDIGEVSALQEINVPQSHSLGCILTLHCSTVGYDVCFTLCVLNLESLKSAKVQGFRFTLQIFKPAKISQNHMSLFGEFSKTVCPSDMT